MGSSARTYGPSPVPVSGLSRLRLTRLYPHHFIGFHSNRLGSPSGEGDSKQKLLPLRGRVGVARCSPANGRASASRSSPPTGSRSSLGLVDPVGFGRGLWTLSRPPQKRPPYPSIYSVENHRSETTIFIPSSKIQPPRKHPYRKRLLA